jgi:anti-sigma regulatory factor (Ser/Thr protein kinase)
VTAGTRGGPLQGRFRGVGSIEDAIKLNLEGGPEAAVSARRALGRLRSELDEGTLESLRLLVTELISNAVRHAGARTVDLMVLVTRPSVRVEVTDRGPGFDPALRSVQHDREGGWGLFLVERLADRWGVAREDLSTRVWFELERRI